MVRQMFDAIAPRYDLLNRLMTLGLDQGWRRRSIGALGLAPSALVLDLACGTGDFVVGLAQQGHRSLGADLSLGMLQAAQPGASPLVQSDGQHLPFRDGALDGVISGFALRNFADLAPITKEVARVLRSGGRLCLLEVDTPSLPLLSLGHRIWFHEVVPRLGALLSDAQAYRYLPRSVAYLPSFAELRDLLECSGFTEVRKLSLNLGIVQVVTATRSGPPPLARRSR